MGTRHQPRSTRSCELALHAVGAARGRLGGAPLACVWASGVERSPTPDRASSGACGRGPLPTGCGCGERGRGDPSPTPQHALLRAGFARCGGGERAPGGRACCLCVGRPGSSALPPPTVRPLGRAAGARYPLAVGAGSAGVETRHQPHNPRSCELALRAVGAARGRPGGAPLAWLWGVRGRALSHPQPPVLRGVRPGPPTPWLWVRGVWAWGPVTNPTARALASWLCALWGQHEGPRRGMPGCGASGVRRYPTADRPSFGACGRGPLLTGCWRGGSEHGDPSPTPPCTLLRAGFARCAGGTRAPGEGASCLCAGRPGSGALPPPTARPFGGCGRGPLPSGCWCGGCGRGDPSPTPQRALLRPGFARCGGGTRVPGGGHLLPGFRASGVGRSPDPDRLSFQGCGRGPLPTACGCGGCGRGDPSPTPQCALLRAGFARCGGGTGVPGGGAPVVWVWGVRGRALPQPRPPVLWVVQLGPTTHCLWVRGVWARGPVINPTTRALASWICALWGWHEGARGGGAPVVWVWGVRGRALSHPRPPVLWGVRLGPTSHWLLVRGMQAWGPVTNPTARALWSWLCALLGQHEGAQAGRLLPLCGASGVELSPTPNRPSFGACGRGPPPTGCGCGGCGRWDPSPNPTVRALASWLCALWGQHQGAHRGRLLLVCGASGVERSPIPDRPSFWGCGRGPLPTGCGCGGCGRGDPLPTPQRALLRAGFARRGGGTRMPGGGRLLPECGASGVGRSPTPDRPFFGACGRGPIPTCCGCGGCGRWDLSRTPLKRYPEPYGPWPRGP